MVVATFILVLINLVVTLGIGVFNFIDWKKEEDEEFVEENVGVDYEDAEKDLGVD